MAYPARPGLAYGHLERRHVPMKPFLTAAVFSASVALGVPAAAQQALVARPETRRRP